MDTDTPRTEPTARSRRSYVGPGSTREPARPQVSAELIAALAARLRPRDTWLLELLHEHRVLTTAQICDLAFTSISAATHRMLTLWRLRAVERFRPSVPAGSAPLHYVLGPAGAAILADRRGMSTAEFGYRPDHAMALASSARLAHLVGSHTLFTSLIAHARAHPGTELKEWWSERRCAAMWGRIVRPDGYGTWRQDGHRVSFFTEYDTGTEPLNRLLAKIGDYTALAEMTGITDTPALFVLPNPTRERHLHAHTHPNLPLVATTTPTALQAAGGPAGPAWQPTQATYRRQRLIDLSALTRTTEVQP
ncbi:replication-relaxation family protein [Actinomadura sp. SCN-SB]|uniref:replication-relaxation family protein n=1 Tax=Actinomadura sp. SCN-SB TaxID=3373092 RepID=UPI00374FFB38